MKGERQSEANSLTAAKRKVEVFTAGCAVCDEMVVLVKSMACPLSDVEVLNMREAAVAAKAKRYGVVRLPAVAIDGKLTECWTSDGVDEQILRAALLGVVSSRVRELCGALAELEEEWPGISWFSMADVAHLLGITLQEAEKAALEGYYGRPRLIDISTRHHMVILLEEGRQLLG